MNYQRSLIFTLLFGSAISLSAQRVTLKFKGQKLGNILTNISRQTGLSLAYSSRFVDLDKRVTISVRNQDLSSVMGQLLTNTSIGYKLQGKKIYLFYKTPHPVTVKTQVFKTSYQNNPKKDKNNSSHDSFTGIVTDAKGNPIVGASIYVDGKAYGITDTNGRFSIINASPTSKIHISYIGYKSQLVNLVNAKQVILQEKNNLLDETVVVGYGINKKIDLSGAVSYISAEKINKRPTVTLSSALQGLASGVTVTTQSGSPGGDGGNIRIRGIGTFGGDSAAPLILIDGVEGTIDEVDPTLVESISILKDASSASIYGSRAANGVILITTKRAKGTDNISINYKGYAGFQTPTMLPKTVDAIEYMQLEDVAYQNDGANIPYSDDYINKYRKGIKTDPDNYPNTNWQKAVLTRSGFNMGHTLTLSISSNRIKIQTSAGYITQQGLVESSNYKRLFLRNNMDILVSNRLSFKIDISFLNGNRLQSPFESTAFNYMNTRTANIVNKFSTGLYNGSGLLGLNPVLLLKDGGNNKTNILRFTGAFSLKYTILDGFYISAQLTPRYITKNNHKYINSVQTYGDPKGTTIFKSTSYNSLTESAYRYLYGNYQILINYQKSLGLHNLKFMFGTERETYDEKTLTAYRQVFNYPQYDVIDAGNIENQNNGGNEYQWALQSYFCRVNYNYKERYLIEANLRADGSSRFNRTRRYGLFPSFSGAWRIGEEPFMKFTRGIIDDLKIRGSWGMLGNQNIGDTFYPTIQMLSTGTISMGGHLYPIGTQSTLANPDLSWETSEMTDIGLDMFLWKHFNVTFDWYYKVTRNILMKLDIPLNMGLNAPFQNIGKVQNIGWEIGMNYTNQWKDFTLGINANLSNVSNKIINMNGTTSTNGTIRNEEGHSINSIYGLVSKGFIESQQEADWINSHCPQFGGTVYPGDLKYQDINNDGQITTDDNTIIGSTIPRYSYSLGINFSYKRFNLGIFFQGIGKVDGYLNTYYVQPNVQGGTYRKEHLDYWKEDNKNASTPRLSYKSTNNTHDSSFWMRNAAYLRLKNLQLGYDIPHNILTSIGIKSAYIYINAQNLLTFTNFYQGYDPEVNYNPNVTDGVSLGAANNYPQVKTFTCGIELTF